MAAAHSHHMEAESPNEKLDSSLPLYSPSAPQYPPKPSKARMILRRTAFIFSFVFVATIVYAAIIPGYTCRRRNPHVHHDDVESSVASFAQSDAPLDLESFRYMLYSASPDVLHRLLHAYLPDRYRHGVYESDKHALEVVHADDAGLSQSIVQIAKRQDAGNRDNSTTPTSEPSSSSPTATTEVPTTSPSPTQSPSDPPTETTSLSSSTSSSTPSSTSSSSSSSSPSPSPSPSPTNTPTKTSSSISTSTTSPTSTQKTSTRLDTTTTDENTSSFSSRTTIRTFTSTDANGDVSVVTSTEVVVVRPTPTEEPDNDDDDSSPDLQDAAPSRGYVGVSALIGALVAAFVVA